MSVLSKAQIDTLGDRLRKGEDTIDDLILLDAYRDSFQVAFEEVEAALTKLGLLPTGRISKTTESIREKLKRQTLRLSRMQDIAGCRVVVPNCVRQDELVRELAERWGDHLIFDRREKPSHGYRAVHMTVRAADELVEIQVRTEAEHHWAETSEKLAQGVDRKIKYGGGPSNIRYTLDQTSSIIGVIERLETFLLGLSDATAAAHHLMNIEKSKTFIRNILTTLLEIYLPPDLSTPGEGDSRNVVLY